MLSKENYKEGKKEGEYSWYYENGQLNWKMNFKDGKREGAYFRYDRNGQLVEKRNYKDGKFIETIKP